MQQVISGLVVDLASPMLATGVVLEFESRPWRTPAEKLDAVRTELGLSPAQYYRVLGVVIDSPEALRSDPVLVHRLQRLREHRVVNRQRRLGVLVTH